MTALDVKTDVVDAPIWSPYIERFLVKPLYETLGADYEPFFFSLDEGYRLISSALHVLRNTQNQKVAENAKRLLILLYRITQQQCSNFTDFNNLPKLHASNIEDNSILIEWIFNDFRIGFSFEAEANESGWYLVSSEKLGDIHASGYLSRIDNAMLLTWLLGFVLMNS